MSRLFDGLLLFRFPELIFSVLLVEWFVCVVEVGGSMIGFAVLW